MPEDKFEELIKLSYFSDLAKAIVSETTVKGVLEKLMDAIGNCFAPLDWSVLVLDRGSDELVFKIAVGKAAMSLVGMRIPANEGIAGWVCANGKELLIEDAASDPRWSGRVDGLTGFSTESIIAVPLKTEDRVFGVIELVNKLDGGRFSALEMRTLATIADFAAIAIEKAVYLAQVRKLAMNDPLTGLLNRRGLARVMDRERTRLRRYGGSMAFIIADIDDFKRINDTKGHDTGDAVLKCVAETLLSKARESDAVARMGGDEFLVAMIPATLEEAERARQRFASALESASASSSVGPFSVSLGVHASDDGDVDALLRGSDKDLYRRKEERQAGQFGGRVIEMLDGSVD